MTHVRPEVAALHALGPLPDEDRDDVDDATVERMEQLLGTIEQPATPQEAQLLVELFPATSCFGLDWTLLHLVESTPGWPLDDVIARCSSDEWRHRLAERAARAERA